MNSSTPLPISHFISRSPIPFPQPAFIPFLCALHHNFPSNSLLTSTYCITCLRAGKKKCQWEGEGSQIHITFCVFACQVINGRWVEVKSGSIFIFPSSVSFCTRHGSTCKLAAKGEVENNYGSDVAREKWVYCLTCNEVESWQAGFVRLADLNARKWLFCTVNQQEKIANYKCRAPPAAWQAYWWPRVALHVLARMNINANILDESH